MPDDDFYLYCDDCNREFEGDCPIHGPLIVVHDKPAADDGSDQERPYTTQPDGIDIRKSRIPGAGKGVWVTTDVPKGVRYGPYAGVIVDDQERAQESGFVNVSVY